MILYDIILAASGNPVTSEIAKSIFKAAVQGVLIPYNIDDPKSTSPRITININDIRAELERKYKTNRLAVIQQGHRNTIVIDL
jgi:hypothetical protein